MPHTPAAVLLAIVLVACATPQKDKCLRQNWFEFGKQAGLRGGQIDDAYLESCRMYRVQPDETEIRLGMDAARDTYCAPDAAYQRAVTGESTRLSRCPESAHAAITEQMDAGFTVHCDEPHGYTRGQSGLPNPQVCKPGKSKTLYDNAYRRGRRTHLSHRITTLQKQIQDADRELLAFDTQVIGLSQKLTQLRFDRQSNTSPQNVFESPELIEDDLKSIGRQRDQLLIRRQEWVREIPRVAGELKALSP